MMDEAYLLEHVKEQLCFVSQDVRGDLAAARTRRSPHRWARRGAWEAGGRPVQQRRHAGAAGGMSLLLAAVWPPSPADQSAYAAHCLLAQPPPPPAHPPRAPRLQARVRAARRPHRHVGSRADGGGNGGRGGSGAASNARRRPAAAQAAGAGGEQRAVHGARGPVPPGRCGWGGCLWGVRGPCTQRAAAPGHTYEAAEEGPQACAMASPPAPACLDLQSPRPGCRADIGMEEAGLAEAIAAAVQAAHPHLHSLLYSNVLLTGRLHCSAQRLGTQAGMPAQEAEACHEGEVGSRIRPCIAMSGARYNRRAAHPA